MVFLSFYYTIGIVQNILYFEIKSVDYTKRSVFVSGF
jgi:hypothetical protein